VLVCQLNTAERATKTRKNQRYQISPCSSFPAVSYMPEPSYFTMMDPMPGEGNAIRFCQRTPQRPSAS
jgi:hypothetical protein